MACRLSSLTFVAGPQNVHMSSALRSYWSTENLLRMWANTGSPTNFVIFDSFLTKSQCLRQSAAHIFQPVVDEFQSWYFNYAGWWGLWFEEHVKTVLKPWTWIILIPTTSIATSLAESFRLVTLTISVNAAPQKKWRIYYRCTIIIYSSFSLSRARFCI